MKANHNVEDKYYIRCDVVIKERKSKVWKQITTAYCQIISLYKLLSKNVNLKFESKSQPGKLNEPKKPSCYQRT